MNLIHCTGAQENTAARRLFSSFTVRLFPVTRDLDRADQSVHGDCIVRENGVNGGTEEKGG